MGAYSKEIEKTFFFSEDKLEHIIETFNSINSKKDLSSDYKLVVRDIKHTFTAHFLFQNDNTNNKNRIKFYLNNSKKLLACYSPKISQTKENDPFQTYLEFNTKKKLIDQSFMEELERNPPVLCCYVKEKLKFNVKINKQKMKIGIDKIISFNPTDIKDHSFPFYHIEFECNNYQSLVDFFNSAFYNENLKNFLSEVHYSDSKWVKALEYCRKDYKLFFQSKDELTLYLLGIFEKLLPEASLNNY